MSTGEKSEGLCGREAGPGALRPEQMGSLCRGHWEGLPLLMAQLFASVEPAGVCSAGSGFILGGKVSAPHRKWRESLRDFYVLFDVHSKAQFSFVQTFQLPSPILQHPLFSKFKLI